MEHRLVFAVVAKERDVFAEIHVFEVIGDKAAVATLYAFAKIMQNFVFCVAFHSVFCDFIILIFGSALAKVFRVCF